MEGLCVPVGGDWRLFLEEHCAVAAGEMSTQMWMPRSAALLSGEGDAELDRESLRPAAVCFVFPHTLCWESSLCAERYRTQEYVGSQQNIIKGDL